MPTRREFLAENRRHIVRAATVGVGTAAVMGVVEAAQYDQQPAFVDLEYADVEDDLLRYRPLFDLTNVEIRPTTVYAWKATSTEQSTVMYCYWVWYAAGQEGVSEADSHVPDREPVYVEVDPATDEVVAVHFDQYHYLHRQQRAPTVYEDTHPSLKVIEPWHPYREQPDTSRGELLEIDSMHEVYTGWLDNDWQVHKPAVVNPWSVQYRGHWWADGTLGVSVNGGITKAAFAVRETVGFDPISIIRST